jgi:hypothetical protein
MGFFGYYVLVGWQQLCQIQMNNLETQKRDLRTTFLLIFCSTKTLSFLHLLFVH